VEFFDHLPTVWDTTRVVSGEIGKYIVTARRSGETWFVGGITNNDRRTVNIPLAFLDEGRNYLASVYADGGVKIPTRTHVGIGKYIVRSKSAIAAELKPSGGMAIEIRPATDSDMRTYAHERIPQ
jgi:alpha-glucosidase